MANVTTTHTAIEILRGADDAFPGESLTALKRAVIHFDHDGQDVAGGDTLRIDAKAAIEGALRNGKTVTVRSAGLYACAHDGTSGYGMKTVAVATQYAQGIPTTSDYSTNAAVAAATVLKRHFALLVGFSEA